MKQSEKLSFDFRTLEQNDEDLQGYKSCFDRNDSPKDLEQLRWLHFENPSKKTLVTLAQGVDEVQAGFIAGIYAALPVDFLVNGGRVPGAQSLDTLTDFRARGKGLFTTLAEQSFKRYESMGVRMIYGFPNGNSAHGFFTKLGWSSLDPVPFIFRPLRVNYFLKRLPLLKSLVRFLPDIPLYPFWNIGVSSPRIRVLDRFDERVSQVWKSFSSNVKVAVVRDAKYLNWRYFDKPSERYEVLGYFDESDTLRAVIVYTLKEKHGGSVGYIMELLHTVDSGCAASALLRYSLHDLAKRKCDVVLAWSFQHSLSHSIYRKELFFGLPEKLRPIELHFGVRSFSKGLDDVLKNRSNWYLSYSDSDTV